MDAELVSQGYEQENVHGEEGASDPAMRRTQPRASPHGVLDNRRLSRTSTAVSQRADPQGSVPDCSDTPPVQPLQTLHESRPDAHTTDATDNGSLPIQYYGY
jgi:hypothetical protein